MATLHLAEKLYHSTNVKFNKYQFSKFYKRKGVFLSTIIFLSSNNNTVYRGTEKHFKRIHNTLLQRRKTSTRYFIYGLVSNVATVRINRFKPKLTIKISIFYYDTNKHDIKKVLFPLGIFSLDKKDTKKNFFLLFN